MGVQDFCVAKYNELRRYGLMHGVEFKTIDQAPLVDFDAFLFSDLPSRFWLKKLKNLGVPMFLITEECPCVTGIEFSQYPFHLFDRVFTWVEDLLEGDPEKFKRISIHSYIIQVPYKVTGDRLLPFVMINSNKTSSHSSSQYQLRNRVIDFFDCRAEQTFHLYGQRWNRRSFPLNEKLGRFLNSRFFDRFFYQQPPKCYKGVVDSKFDVLTDSEFTFCIENATGPRGYVTEKIFDAFFCGSIPIFFGDQKVFEMFPRDLFIYGPDFSDIESLVHNCLSMDRCTKIEIRRKIEAFVKSPEFSDRFGSHGFCATVLEGINSVIENS